MSSDKLIDNYPGIRDTSEVARLHIQHELVVDALGSPVLCPVDLARPGLRILDVGTADGWWLTQLRKELKHPDSATLIGTDLAPYPDSKENIVIHNFKTPFPDEWKGTFDLVQLRAVLSNVPGDASIDLIKRTLELLKPGGYIQIVDASLPSGKLKGDEKPHIQVFSHLGNFLNDLGLNADQGSRAAESLKAAGEGHLENLNTKEGFMHLGKGSRNEETGWQWLRFMALTSKATYVKRGYLSEDEFERLQLEMFEEAKTEGFKFKWYGAWASKSTNL